MDVQFCTECLIEALERYGIPDIFNTDHGSQFTSNEFTSILKEHTIQISMDGKRRWVDNVFTERLWRSLKQNEIYRNDYESPADALRGISDYFQKYNSYDPHQSLKYQTPDSVYFQQENVQKFQSISTLNQLSHTHTNNQHPTETFATFLETVPDQKILV